MRASSCLVVTCLELQEWSSGYLWPDGDLLWFILSQGPYVSGRDILEFPKRTFKLDLTLAILAINNILCSDSYILFPRCSFVSKHVVPAFSQSLKCAIDYLKPVLAECPNAGWFKMWVPPWLQIQPGIWSFETYPEPICSIKMDNGTKANRGIIVLEKSMH